MALSHHCVKLIEKSVVGICLGVLAMKQAAELIRLDIFILID